MPELPEVETTKNGVKPFLDNQKVKQLIVRQPKLRWPVPTHLPSVLKDQTVRHVSRRGKYLLLQFDQGTVLVHLGMSGSLRVIDLGTEPQKHDHVDLELHSGKVLRFHDPRRFGCWLWTEQDVNEHELLVKLGPEPLSENFTPEHLYLASRKRKTSIKQLIMDSHMVVGVGNIYANEALFLAGLRPTMKAGKLTQAKSVELHGHIVAVLSKAIAQGGTTLQDFQQADGQPGYFAQELLVYGRTGQPCVQCGETLKETRINNRSTVYCPVCQPSR